jgi:hypothetical protein
MSKHCYGAEEEVDKNTLVIFTRFQMLGKNNTILLVRRKVLSTAVLESKLMSPAGRFVVPVVAP